MLEVKGRYTLLVDNYKPIIETKKEIENGKHSENPADQART